MTIWQPHISGKQSTGSPRHTQPRHRKARLSIILLEPACSSLPFQSSYVIQRGVLGSAMLETGRLAHRSSIEHYGVLCLFGEIKCAFFLPLPCLSSSGFLVFHFANQNVVNCFVVFSFLLLPSRAFWSSHPPAHHKVAFLCDLLPQYTRPSRSSWSGACTWVGNSPVVVLWLDEDFDAGGLQYEAFSISTLSTGCFGFRRLGHKICI